MAINYMPQHCEHDGCNGCKYEHRDYDELPCIRCKQNFKDCWTAKEDAEYGKGKRFVDQAVLLERLWNIMKEDNNREMQTGIFQAILIVTLMDTAEAVERGDVPYDETDCV